MKNQKAIDRIIVKVAIDISKAVKGLEEYRKKVAEKRDIEEELRQQIKAMQCCGNCAHFFSQESLCLESDCDAQVCDKWELRE